VNIHEDFEEFLRLLSEENAEFIIVGGYAVAFHGYVRATDDMDLLRNKRESARPKDLADVDELGGNRES
jgi:hypothetical protein|tara:strand:- start:171 stop:377 length:207 start_codon:yes stop_codon:yes gene_type:complete